MGVVSTEHATGNDPANDARALLLEVCTGLTIFQSIITWYVRVSWRDTVVVEWSAGII